MSLRSCKSRAPVSLHACFLLILLGLLVPTLSLADPQISIPGDQVQLDSSIPFTTAGATTNHTFSIASQPDGGGTVLVSFTGSFTEFGPRVRAEGQLLGSQDPKRPGQGDNAMPAGRWCVANT